MKSMKTTNLQHALGERVHQPNQATLDIVNELLQKPGLTSMNGYCVGVICALAWEAREEPPRTVLEAAADVESIEQAIGLWQSWKRLRK